MSVAVFLLHIFRMPLFFLLAGFFAHLLFYRLGTRQFLRNRAARIALPLLLGWIACFVSIAGVMLWFLAKKNGGQMPAAVPPDLAKAGLNFLHLWFLYLLCWLYAIGLLFHSALRAIDSKNTVVTAFDRATRFTVSGAFKSLLLALPISIAFILQPAWVGWFGIDTPAYTLIPPIVPLFIYGYIFGLGWLLSRQRELLEQLAKSWQLRLAVGFAAALVCLAMAGSSLSLAPIEAGQTKLIYAAMYGVAIVSLMLGFIGLGLRFLAHASPVFRYLSDASYWMFIAHLPVVMALQTALIGVNLHWSVKFVIVTGTTSFVLLLTYRYWVRSTWIGQMLNGKKYS